jgi:hypothetical protein
MVSLYFSPEGKFKYDEVKIAMMSEDFFNYCGTTSNYSKRYSRDDN